MTATLCCIQEGKEIEFSVSRPPDYSEGLAKGGPPDFSEGLDDGEPPDSSESVSSGEV